MSSGSSETPSGNNSPPPVVVDLGKKSKKRIKALRKGKGKLLEDVHKCISELQSSGAVQDGAQVVVVVVEEKGGRRLPFL